MNFIYSNKNPFYKMVEQVENYIRLVEAVKAGVFENKPIGPYLEHVLSVSEYKKSVLGSHDTLNAFGCTIEELTQQTNDFMVRERRAGGMLSVGNITCLEDEVSVVFLDPTNDKNLKLYVTLYNYSPAYGSLLMGSVELRDVTSSLYNVTINYACHVLNNQVIEPFLDASLNAIVAHDLIQATVTTIEQLVYMQTRGGAYYSLDHWRAKKGK